MASTIRDSGVHVPSKRVRTPSSSDSDTADGRPLASIRRPATDAMGLQTPPPSSPIQPSSADEHLHSATSQPSYSASITTHPLLRDVYLKNIRTKFPDLDVINLNDFDILTLASTHYDGSVDDVHGWLVGEFKQAATFMGSSKQVMDACRLVLDVEADVTGLKPDPHSPEAKLCPVDGSEYSMRIWPGSLEGREWCMDFVRSATHEPINSPFQFELWIVPPSTGYSSGPWQPAEAHRVYSLENCFGIDTKDVISGAEKFVLNDGQTYLLLRPGIVEGTIQFTVPSRAFPVTVNNGAKLGTFR